MTLAQLLLGQGLLVDTTALASVALIGYLFGRRSSRAKNLDVDVTLLIELARAQSVAKELEHVSLRLRTEVQSHLAALSAFQGQVERMQRGASPAEWRQLRQHADALMGPTMTLASSLALASDEMREQQSHLATFCESRTDRETGAMNRRALVEHLLARLTVRGEGRKQVALVLCSIDVDPLETSPDGIGRLADLVQLMEQYARSGDLVARYGPQEFALLLPRTTLAGALVVGERLMKVTDASFERRIWSGVVEAEIGESPEELLARAESALRVAAREDCSTIFLHDGASIRRHCFELPSPPCDRLALAAALDEDELAGSAANGMP